MTRTSSSRAKVARDGRERRDRTARHAGDIGSSECDQQVTDPFRDLPVGQRGPELASEQHEGDAKQVRGRCVVRVCRPIGMEVLVQDQGHRIALQLGHVVDDEHAAGSIAERREADDIEIGAIDRGDGVGIRPERAAERGTRVAGRRAGRLRDGEPFPDVASDHGRRRRAQQRVDPATGVRPRLAQRQQPHEVAETRLGRALADEEQLAATGRSSNLGHGDGGAGGTCFCAT